MEDKFTLRDFLVYFTTGLYLLLVLLRVFDSTLLDFFKISKVEIKENEAVTIFLLLPGLYLIGHFIHGIDLIFFKLGRYFWDYKTNHLAWLKRNYLLWFFDFFILLLNGYRVTGMLNKKNIPSKEFWKKASKLQYLGKYDKAEYWNLMNDLFKGLTLISFMWVLFNLFHFSTLNFLFSIILTLIFWNRARHMAVNFVSTTINTYDAITN